MDILGIIPARGSSKGLPRKNLHLILGKPLLAYTIMAAQKSGLITRLIVSTEDKEIAEVAAEYGVEVLERPVELATDDSPIDDTLRFSTISLREAESRNGMVCLPDIVVLMQANVPVRKVGMIDTVIRDLIFSKADSAVSVYKVDQRPEWMKVLDAGRLYPRDIMAKGYSRQDFPDYYLMDGAVMAVKAEVLVGTAKDRSVHAWLGSNVRGVIQEKFYATEIDSAEDVAIAEAILWALKKEE